MSRTHTGSSGSYLPVLDDCEALDPDCESVGSDFNMTTYQLPRPCMFGADSPSSFTEPTRYDPIGHFRRTQETQSSSYDEQYRRAYHEPLPSVSQLLTPGSQSSIPHSPYSPQHSPDLDVVPYSYHGGYETAPPLHQRRDTNDSRPTPYHPLGPVNQHQYSYPVSPSVTMQHYTPYPNVHPQAPQPNVHRPIAPLVSPIQVYHGEIANRHSRPSSVSGGESGGRRTGSNTVKPLPQVVGEQIIPGEGPCWVYKDGSTCKKVIDGEVVNAQWGITKAGKPRKRLAIACTTCREKKIKCDPGEPKCVQCEKFGRECRFTTAHRGQQASPESPSYNYQACDPIKSPPIERSLQPSLDQVGDESEGESCAEGSLADSGSDPKKDRQQSKCDYDAGPRASQGSKAVGKRRRQKSPDVTGMKPQYKAGKQSASRKHESSTRATMALWESTTENMNVHSFDWANDPYQVDPEITMHYMETYFMHVNAATYRLFPRKLFIDWVRGERVKSPDDLMLIYTLLAMGSIFSSRTERKHEGSLFGKIARFAVERNHGNYSLQLIQSRLLLAFYHFSMGDTHKAWDYGGMGFRVVSGLRLNVEDGITDIGDDDILEYGLNRHAVEECRRRTFWAAYIMDRFSGFCSGHLCAIHNEDSFVRLPCTEEAYERQEAVETPYFDNELTDQRLCHNENSSKLLGPMAYYAQIASIWGDVLANIYRSPHQSVERYSADHEAFHVTIHQRLHSWRSNLPGYLRYNSSNTNASIENGYMGTFISLHTVYHATIMKLNRNIRHAHLSSASVKRSLHEARHHALQLLEILQTLSKAERPKPTTLAFAQTDHHHQQQHQYQQQQQKQQQQQQFRIPFSTPFAGYAVLTAIDILSAAGSLEPTAFTSILSIMNGGLSVIEELSQFWSSARAQCKAIWRRVEQLAEEATRDEAVGKKVWIARRPLDKTFGSEQDCFYSDEMQVQEEGEGGEEMDRKAVGEWGMDRKAVVGEEGMDEMKEGMQQQQQQQQQQQRRHERQHHHHHHHSTLLKHLNLQAEHHEILFVGGESRSGGWWE